MKADSLLVVAARDGTEVARVPAPKPLTCAQERLRALQRKAARQAGPYDPAGKKKRKPSKRWLRTQARIARSHARATNVRRDVLHKATTRLAQQTGSSWWKASTLRGCAPVAAPARRA